MNDRAVEAEFVFGRHAATELSVAYAILVPQRQARIARPGQEGRPPRDERGDLRPGLQRPAEEGRDDRVADRRRCASTPRRPGLTSRKSGSSKTRAIPGRPWSARPWRRCGTWPPRAAWTWCWCYSPDRLARKFAYQALLLEEFARAGVRVEFVKGPRGDTPEDQLLVQFQGIFAEYEKAQLAERYRRGKAHRARTGSVNVLSGAPFGYRYVRKTDLAGAAYEIIEDQAVLVAEMFRRYADDGASIADLARWLTGQGVPTRTGKHRWDRSVIWAHAAQPRLCRARRCSARPWPPAGHPG